MSSKNTKKKNEISESYPLTHLEKQAIVGATLRERILMEELRNEFQKTLEAIEERIGLSPGALSTTHVIDLQSGIVSKRPVSSTDSETPDEPEGTEV